MSRLLYLCSTKREILDNLIQRHLLRQQENPYKRNNNLEVAPDTNQGYETMKYINRNMAVLAATSTFIALNQLYDEEYSDHFTLGEYTEEFTINFFSDDNSHLNEVMRKIQNFIQGAKVTYGYLSDTKSYTATINFEFEY